MGRKLLGAVEMWEVMDRCSMGSFVHPGLSPVLGMRQSTAGHQQGDLTHSHPPPARNQNLKGKEDL